MKIKPYYCRNCGQFRGFFQVFVPNPDMPRYVACKYCHRYVIEVEPHLEKFLETMVDGPGNKTEKR